VNYLVTIIVAYLIGSVPFSLIFAKIFRGIDVRQAGTGNVGATNTLVQAGKKAGALAMVFDVAKGVGAVLLARIFVGGPWIEALAGVAAILGHDFSIFLGFKGGKGISSTAGAIIALNPYAMMICLAFYALFFALTRFLILSSLLCLAVMPLVFFFLKDEPAYIVFSLLTLILGLYVHRTDISRLLSGQERKLQDMV
jgi:glycerol-3-phosphate acyltransferase PlsY